jgi:hypothetical protein
VNPTNFHPIYWKNLRDMTLKNIVEYNMTRRMIIGPSLDAWAEGTSMIIFLKSWTREEDFLIMIMEPVMAIFHDMCPLLTLRSF